MVDIFERLSSIEHKLRDALHTFNDLKERNEVLVEENKFLQNQKIQLQKQVDALSAGGVETKMDVKCESEFVEVKQELKNYISEIDSCINILKS